MKHVDASVSITAPVPRRSTIATALLASCFLMLGIGGTAAATVPDPSGTPPAESTTAPQATDAPDDTEVPGDETAQEAEEDESLDVAPIAIVGFVILLVVASWWMVRRDDVDDQPSPPPPGEPEWRADQVAP